MALAVQRFGVQRGPLSQTLMSSAVGVRPRVSATGLVPKQEAPAQGSPLSRVQRTALSPTLRQFASAMPTTENDQTGMPTTYRMTGGFEGQMARHGLSGFGGDTGSGFQGFSNDPEGESFGMPTSVMMRIRQQQQMAQQGQVGQPGSFGGGGGVTNAPGWEALNRFNAEFAIAAQQTGAPANLLKAMVKHESSGNWERDNYVNYSYRNDAILPFVGMFRKTAESYGINFDSLVGNRQAQINSMGTVLSHLAKQYGGYENATKVYFGGPAALTAAGFTDELGTHSSQYAVAIQEWKQLDSMGGGSQGSFTGGGGMASLGGEWSPVDRWNPFVTEASSQTGVPGNLIKAVMKLESGGNAGAVSVQGAMGLMQVMPFHGPSLGLNLSDPRQNVLAGARILKQGYDQYGSWDMAVRAYLGFGTDALGTSDTRYLDIVNGNLGQLNAASGGGGLIGAGGSFPGFGPGQAGGAIAGFGASGVVHDWGEFNAPSTNGYYSYGTGYGMNGVNHTGLDVMGAVGERYFAPMGGTVTCGGWGRGQSADGGGCAAFGDFYGKGAGRVEVLLDNGAMLIYGHSSEGLLQPGQRFQAGQALGTIGGMNSPHVHLEARVRDSSTSSGWRIVDPRTVMGGGGSFSGPGFGAPGAFSTGGLAQQALSRSDAFRTLLGGGRLSSYSLNW